MLVIAEENFAGGIHSLNRFVEVCESVNHGLLWIDHNLLVQGGNRPFSRLLEIENDFARFFGRPIAEMLEFLIQRGEFTHDDPKAYVAGHLAALRKRKPFKIERIRPNGITVSVSVTPLPSGGYVYVYLDVSQERKLRESVRRGHKASIIAMANLAEHRDMDTGIHVLRVARLVGEIARKLGQTARYRDLVDEKFIDLVSTASILHDVGKISTPDYILLKPSPLTREEFKVIKRHAIDGAQLLKQACLSLTDNSFLGFGVDIALSHHERFDGNGYPNRVQGDDIPLAGRICAVADVFDAVTSQRPYKEPWTREEAVALIQREQGRQFDPDVVDAFLSVIAERDRIQLVQWDDSMSVGHQRIDDQHRILVDTINQLANAHIQNNHHAVEMVIDEMLSYSSFHFSHEEKLMAESGFHGLDEHRQQHQHFIRWFEHFRDDYVTYGRKALGEPILHFLRSWLSAHILQEDKQYAAVVNSANPALCQMGPALFGHQVLVAA